MSYSYLTLFQDAGLESALDIVNKDTSISANGVGSPFWSLPKQRESLGNRILGNFSGYGVKDPVGGGIVPLFPVGQDTCLMPNAVSLPHQRV